MRECAAVRSRRGRLSKADKRRAWESRIKRLYTLTPEDVARQWEAQAGRCVICEQRLEEKVWVIDHDHKTGRFRGLLCGWCNHRVVSMAERAGWTRSYNVLWHLWPDTMAKEYM